MAKSADSLPVDNPQQHQIHLSEDRPNNADPSLSVRTHFNHAQELFFLMLSNFFKLVKAESLFLCAEILRQFHRLSPRAQEEVLEYVQFKLQFEDKIGNRKGN